METVLQPSFADFSPRNPFAPVDRRWRLARYLNEHPRRLRRSWADRWVTRARRFLRTAARHGAGSPRAFETDPAVAHACSLERACTSRKLVVKAALLAGETYDEAARRAGLRAEVVEAFERLFFAVSDKLHAADWLVATLLNELHAESGPSDEAVVMAFALFGGSLVLDGVLAALGIENVPSGRTPSPETIRLARQGIAVKRLVVTGSKASLLLRLALLFDELEMERADESHGAVRSPSMPPLDGRAIAEAAQASREVAAEAGTVATPDCVPVGDSPAAAAEHQGRSATA